MDSLIYRSIIILFVCASCKSSEDTAIVVESKTPKQLSSRIPIGLVADATKSSQYVQRKSLILASVIKQKKNRHKQKHVERYQQMLKEARVSKKKLSVASEDEFLNLMYKVYQERVFSEINIENVRSAENSVFIVLKNKFVFVVLETEIGGKVGMNWHFYSNKSLEKLEIPIPKQYGSCNVSEMPFKMYLVDSDVLNDILLFIQVSECAAGNSGYYEALALLKKSLTIVKGSVFTYPQVKQSTIWNWDYISKREPTWILSKKKLFHRRLAPKIYTYETICEQTNSKDCVPIAHPVWDFTCKYLDESVKCSKKLIKKGYVKRFPGAFTFYQCSTSKCRSDKYKVLLGELPQLKRLGFYIHKAVVDNILKEMKTTVQGKVGK